MRAAAVIFVVAGAILGAFILISEPTTTAPGTLGRGERGRGPDAGSIEGVRGEAAGDPAHLDLPIVDRRERRSPRKAVGLIELAAERGVAGDAVLSMLDRMKGSRVPPLDKKFALEDISRVLNRWLARPDLKEGDIRFILRAWDEVEDPAFRWAMSWLMQRAGDDRFVEPLLELIEVDASRAVDAVAAVGTEKAVRSLAALSEDLPLEANPGIRAKLAVAVAESEWEERHRFLRRAWSDSRRPAAERMAAVVGLSRLGSDALAQQDALSLALGSPQPLEGALPRHADRDLDRDLRSSAVQALMLMGGADNVRHLLDVADRREDDPEFVRMVENHLKGYRGPDISLLLIERARRQNRLPAGVAHYLNRVAQADQLDTLRSLRELAMTEESRELLEGALLNARGR